MHAFFYLKTELLTGVAGSIRVNSNISLIAIVQCHAHSTSVSCICPRLEALHRTAHLPPPLPSVRGRSLRIQWSQHTMVFIPSFHNGSVGRLLRLRARGRRLPLCCLRPAHHKGQLVRQTTREQAAHNEPAQHQCKQEQHDVLRCRPERLDYSRHTATCRRNLSVSS